MSTLCMCTQAPLTDGYAYPSAVCPDGLIWVESLKQNSYQWHRWVCDGENKIQAVMKHKKHNEYFLVQSDAFRNLKEGSHKYDFISSRYR